MIGPNLINGPSGGETCEVVSSTYESAPAPEPASTRLADFTTLRVGGPARRLVVARTEEELVGTVRDADSRGEPALLLGEGSNVVVSDQGFDGVVVLVATRGLNAEVSDCAGAFVRIAAGGTIDEVRPDHCRPSLDTSAVTAPSTFSPPQVTSMVTVTVPSATALTVPTHRTSTPSSSSGTTTGCVNLAE